MKNIPLEEVARVIGEDDVQRLLTAFPGGQIYCRRDFKSVQSRNKIIVDDFYSSTLNRSELAAKYDLSLSSIDKILKDAAESKHNI